MSDERTQSSIKRFLFKNSLHSSRAVKPSELPKSVTEKLEFLKTHKEAIKTNNLNDFIHKQSSLLTTNEHVPANDAGILKIVSSRTASLVNSTKTSSSPRLANLKKTTSARIEKIFKFSKTNKSSSQNDETTFKPLPISSTNTNSQKDRRDSIHDAFEEMFGDDDSGFCSTQIPKSSSTSSISSSSRLSLIKSSLSTPEFTSAATITQSSSVSSLGSTNDAKPKKKFTFGRGATINVLDEWDSVSFTTNGASLSQPTPAPTPALKPVSSTLLNSHVSKTLAKPVLPGICIAQPSDTKSESIEEYDKFLLSNIDWDNEDVDWDNDDDPVKEIDLKLLDSPPRSQSDMKPTQSGITMADYVDDDFDISILGTLDDDEDFEYKPKHNTVQKTDLDATVCWTDDGFGDAANASLPGPSASSDLLFVPVEKDAKSRKDDTAAFRKEYHHSSILRDILHEKFGLNQFRPNQEEIINASLEQHDCFVLMPTGGGKSLCYQLPAILTPGVTIVISPLRALILDQVNKLKSLDIPAAHMCADLSKNAQNDVVRLLSQLEPGLKLLFLTPEKIVGSRATYDLITGLYGRGKLARIVLDEAHCLSQWGHDFRPDYKQLSTLRRNFPSTPIMCLTATATNVVQQDVINVLKLKNIKTFIRSFNRPNIKYAVLEKTKTVATESIARQIKANFHRMSGIVYCLGRKDCDNLALDLRKAGIKAQSYHAGLSDKQREKVQGEWMNNVNNVICATIAFGMGIDKPDVRFVIHNSMPKSVEAFYQESGRGGRDGEVSYSYLYYAYSDVVRLQKLIRMDKSITKRNLEAHFDQVQQMAQYCENKIDCRRYLQLLHLGEKFDRRLCIKDAATICDNCQNYGRIGVLDVVKEARELATIVRELGTTNSFTMLHYVDVYKGSKVKKVMSWKHHTHKYYGAGAHLEKNDIHRIMKELSFSKVLTDTCTYTGDFPIIYTKPGPNYKQLFETNAVITIPVTKSKKKATKKSADEFKEPEPPVALPVVAVEQPVKRTATSKVAKASPKVRTPASPSKSIENQINNLRIKCHEDLLEQCASFAAQHQSNLSSIMNLSAIKVMSEQMPCTANDYMKIQYVTKANFEKFGKEFLAITRKYRNEVDKLEVQSAMDDFQLDLSGDDWMGASDPDTSRGSNSSRGVKRKISSFKRPNKKYTRKKRS